MLLDKQAVTDLLDKRAGDYHDNLIAINLLPNDAIFEVVIEEVVTAEYYDSNKNDYFRFELSHDYFSYGKEIPESHRRTLDLNINENLLEYKSKVSGESTNTSRLFRWAVTSFLTLMVLFGLTYAYMFYGM